MNGEHVGSTQYVDAFQLANFWTLVKGTAYHTFLNLITTDVQSAEAGPHGILFSSGCRLLGVVSFGWLDGVVTNLISSLGISPDQFPVFLLRNVVMSPSDPPTIGNCCILGYHGAIILDGSVQTYSPADYDSTGDFGPGIADTSILAHEVGEWMDDPLGNNRTPLWGHIGQVTGCQGNLEVGDPLTGTNFSDITMDNGVTYHAQELAFFSWFFGGPSIGAGGLFSNNGTFATDAGPICH